MEFLFPLAIASMVAVGVVGFLYMTRDRDEPVHNLADEGWTSEIIALQAIKPRKAAAKKAVKKPVKRVIKRTKRASR